jgi:UDP-N-acetylglucosamine 2-epimerase
LTFPFFWYLLLSGSRNARVSLYASVFMGAFLLLRTHFYEAGSSEDASAGRSRSSGRKASGPLHLKALAGALAAQACHIPLIHIEAGLRSFNPAMVEEYNRIETDRRSTYLFCPTSTALANLSREGLTTGVYHVGDVMYDATLYFAQQAEQQSHLLEDLSIAPKAYYLATIHRAQTTDHPEQLANILRAFAQIDTPIILPLHPRTRKTIEASTSLTELVHQASNLHIISSVSYMDMLVLEKHAKAILTDSGGVQKEAYFHRTPCITMRQETEWTETVEAGWNTLVGTDTDKILHALAHLAIPNTQITEYGTGHAAQTIIDILCQNEY